MKTHRRRVLVAAIVLLIGASAVPSVRHGVFQSAGRLLVAEDSLAEADAGVMTSESYWSGATLDIADLLAAGRIRRIVILAPVDRQRVAAEFARRGITFEDMSARTARELSLLGVSPDRLVRLGVDQGGTSGEGQALVDWCRTNGVRRLIVMSSPDHGRRLRRRLARAFAGSGTTVAVRLGRYGSFNPDNWWTRRDDLRTGIVELQKLALDVIAHPFSP